MKVTELFEAIGYDPKRKMPTGTSADWMKAIGASKEDVAKAREQVLQSPEYKALLDLGMVDESSDGHKARGSIAMVAKYYEPVALTQWVSKEDGSVLTPELQKELGWEWYGKYKLKTVGAKPDLRTVRLKYTVSPNGKVDFTAPNNFHRWPAPSGKPALVKDKPVESIVKTMRNALDSVARLVGKRFKENKKLFDLQKKSA
jgi:hypothetical protein